MVGDVCTQTCKWYETFAHKLAHKHTEVCTQTCKVVEAF